MEIVPILSSLRRSRTGAILVAAQVALTLAIVANAVFVVKARLAVAGRATGLDEEGVFQLMYVGNGEIEDREAMMQKDLDTLHAIPGVVGAAQLNGFPIGGMGWGLGLGLDRTRPELTKGYAVYFSGQSIVNAFGLRILEGRDFLPGEVRTVDSKTGKVEADAVILTQHLARSLFPDAPTAVGKTLYLGHGDDAPAMRVVGVVSNVMDHDGHGGDDVYDVFILPVKYVSNLANYAVRSAPGQRARVMAEAEKALSALRHDRVRVQFRDVPGLRRDRFRHERAGAQILIAVTIGLLLVTASGIVGIASLWVTQRRKQIGIRRALGARRRDIVWYFVTENLLITSAGVLAGVGLAVGLNLFLVSHAELARLPLTYVGGGMLGAWFLGLVAVLGPAWRAASVAPATATRSV